MDRRHYLALLAAVGTAGCSVEDLPLPEDGDSPGDGTPTDTATPTETATPTDTPTETERQLSEAEREAENRLEDADEFLGEALEEYAAATGADDILGVRPSDGRFDWPPIERVANQAREPLDDARELGYDDQREQADALSRIRRAFIDFARTQSSMGDAFPRFERMQEAYIDERFSDVTGERDPLSRSVSQADSRLDSALNQFNSGDARVSDAVDESVYQGKADQLQGERDAFVALNQSEDDVTRGMRQFRDGVDRYLRERWTPAMDDFQSAIDRLSTAAERMDTDDVDDESFDEPYNELVSLTEALAGAAEHLVESARAYRDRDTDSGNASLSDAQDVLDASRPARRDHDSAGDILDFEGL